MNVFAKVVALAAALALSTQPCLAAAADSQASAAPATIAVAATEPTNFNLATHGQSNAANPAGALPLATAAVTAQEAEASQQRQEREERRRKGPNTALIIGGVALVGLIVLGVAASSQMKKGWDWDW